jgi:DNA-binding transcriptional LysR family regulator
MRGVEYAELETFLTIAREGSFRRAADVLAVSPSAVSHTLRTLEDRLGGKLLHRTTRSVALTEAGQQLRERLLPAFADIKGAVDAIKLGADRPAGRLRLTAPRVAAQMVLAPMLGRFLVRHPAIQVEVTVDDRLVDSVADGFDAGIRLTEQVRRDMDSVAIGPALRGVVVASPAYLATCGVPASPDDLHMHRWLNYRLPTTRRLLPWEFACDGEELALSQDGPLVSNDPDLLIAAALDGAGLAHVTEATVATHVAAGQLVQLLADWCADFSGWRLYYPRNRHMAPALKAFIQFHAEGDR